MSKQNPYSRLLARARQFAFDVKHHHVKHMWTYPKVKLGEPWNLVDLKERVAAADQLGWDVLLKVVDGDLRVEYHKRVITPMEFA